MREHAVVLTCRCGENIFSIKMMTTVVMAGVLMIVFFGVGNLSRRFHSTAAFLVFLGIGTAIRCTSVLPLIFGSRFRVSPP